MKHGLIADFLFVGLAIVPAALMLGGLPHLAILLFVPLLFIACLFGMAEQVTDGGNAARGRADETKHERGGLTFRKSKGESRKAKM